MGPGPVLTSSTGSTVSAVLEISLPWDYPICMCNLTALPPDRPAPKRHPCGTLAARRRSRTAPPAPPQRTKVSQIRYLCAPNCGIFSGAGTALPRLCLFFVMRTAPNWSTHLKNLAILATCFIHNFSCPKLYLGLPFSPPGLAWPPFPSPSATSERALHVSREHPKP